VISYSLVQGLTATTNNNLNGNTSNPYFIFPLDASFAPTEEGDYRIQALGEGINIGNNAAIPSKFTTDLYGNTRIYSSTVDLGAFEVACSSAISLYVDSTKTASGNGESWATAYRTLSEAIAKAQFCTNIQNIYVAKGTYFPSSVNDQDGVFLISRGKLKILGGYPSGGGIRNANANKTILSGDIGTRELDTDNSYHIMIIAGLTNAADSVIIDGFQFVWGKAVVSGTRPYNTFSIPRNAGGGLVLWSNANAGKIQIRNCIFSANRADDIGGAYYSSASSATVVNCQFSGNLANYGGAMGNIASSNTRIVNSTFSGNRAGQSGGAIRNSTSTPTLINSIIYGNNSAISNNSSTTNISYSLVQDFNGTSSGNTDVSGNLYGTMYNPLFIYEINPNLAPTLAGNFKVNLISPIINEGTTVAENTISSVDLGGNIRISDGKIDMGAYENFCDAPTTIYVDNSRTISGNGYSWSDAFKNLTDALALAQSCIQVNTILIAQGTYYPNFQTDRTASFVISRGNLRLIGGYPNGGIGERNVLIHPTILSGDIGLKNTHTDNSYHVLVVAGLGTAADSVVIDGVKIFWGRADGGGSKIINGQTIAQNLGGGLVLFNNQNGSKVQVRNTEVSGNYASDIGAGIYLQSVTNASPSSTFYNCLISGNHANYGGGMANVTTSPTLVNTTIAGNRAGNTGGGIRNSNANPIIKNTILYGNTNGISNAGSSIPIVQYSLIQGLTSTLNNNLNGDITSPNFNYLTDPSIAPTISGDYQVLSGSPIIDRGNNSYLPSFIHQDLNSKTRVYNNTVDLGPYESGCEASFTTLYVDSSISVSGEGSTWVKAFKTLNEALILANSCKDIKEIKIAKGTYYPTELSDRDATFLITRGDLRIYGGYASGGLNRNTFINPTILSGDIGTIGTNTDNSYHVLVVSGITSDEDSLVIDGFSIVWGNANTSGSKDYNQQSIPKNSAGGLVLWNNSNGDKIKIKNCIVSANYASDAGGGIYNYKTSATYLNCLVTGNVANYGAGFANVSNSHVKIVNNTIASNRAGNTGGAMRNSNSNPEIVNTLAYYNSNGISNNSSSPSFKYSLIQDRYIDIDGNVNATFNPQIIAPANFLFAPIITGDFKLQDISPIINKGDNIAYKSAGGSLFYDLDIESKSRVFDFNQDGIIDIGAYEINVDLSEEIIGTIRYVKEGATGNGTSWTNASGDLQAMINVSSKKDQIWVATGSYYPNRRIQDLKIIAEKNRDNSFVLKPGVSLYGGFIGNELFVNQRDFSANPTILSGDFNNNDVVTLSESGRLNFSNNNENAYHVLVAGGISDISLNGFIIIGGNANGSGDIKVGGVEIYRNSGGLFAGKNLNRTTITNCVFKHGSAIHMGGGIDIQSSNKTIIKQCDVKLNNANHGGGLSFRNYLLSNVYQIDKCSIISNNANKDGGGVIGRGGNTQITNSIISGNTAIDNHGGGVYVYREKNNSKAYLTMSGCIVSGNKAAAEGGGLRVATYLNGNESNEGDSKRVELFASIYNCTFSGNKAGNGGGIYRHEARSQLDVVNSIIWGNSSSIKGGEVVRMNVSYSVVEGGFNGNNITFDPLFVDQPSYLLAPFTGGDFQLQSCSEARNSGTSNDIKVDPIDVAGNPRVVGIIDRGAYEYLIETTPSRNWYVKENGYGDGSSWANASGDFQDMINKAQCADKIFVAKGIYVPIRKANDLNLITTFNKENAFVLRRNINYYGGFEGNESSEEQRDLNNPNNETILSGDFLQNDSVTFNSNGILTLLNNSENAYHTVIISNLTNVIFDGFTIKGGNASGSGKINVNNIEIQKNDGGGLAIYYSNKLKIKNLKIKNNLTSNMGGGIFLIKTSNSNFSNVIVQKNKATYGGGIFSYSCNNNYYDYCSISSNNSIGEGGGISAKGGNIYIQNSKINGNYATNSNAGGACFYRAPNEGAINAYLKNCQITGNKANGDGGGIRLARYRSGQTSGLGGSRTDAGLMITLSIYNCTISGNYATLSGGGGVQAYSDGTTDSYIDIVNSIIWDNSSTKLDNEVKWRMKYSILNVARPGVANIVEDPLFANAPSYMQAPFSDGDYSIPSACSPAFNSGDSKVSPIPSTDILGNNRFIEAIDRGAFENQGATIDEGTRYYVSSNGTGDGTSSWSNASSDLQEVINKATCGDEIFVAKGVYKPNRKANNLITISPNHVDNSFTLKSNISLYGGFKGFESNPSQRNLSDTTNRTILSGDFLNNDIITYDNLGLPTFINNSENANHVVVISNSLNVIMDGFTIQNGRANGDNSLTINNQNLNRTYGAGLSVLGSSFINISNCTFRYNHAKGNGGGVYAVQSIVNFANCITKHNFSNQGGGLFMSEGQPNIENCHFESNRATEKGGAVFTDYNTCSTKNSVFILNQAQEGGAFFNSLGSAATFQLCKILGNKATDGGGGGLYNSSESNIQVLNSLITGNFSTKSGAAIRNNNTATIIGCTISGNNCLDGLGGISNYGEKELIAKNTIIYGNSSGVSPIGNYQFCIIEGVNLYEPSVYVENPGFVNAPSYIYAPFTNGNYHLNNCWPANNNGTTTDISELITEFDLDSNTRILDGQIDIGVYETMSNVRNFFVKAGGSGDGSSWTNAIGDLQEAINSFCTGDSIFVANGLYKPNRSANNLTVITPSNRNNAFVLKNNIKIFGGFSATESSLSERVINGVSGTILSGDFNGNDSSYFASNKTSLLNNSENAFQVFIAARLENIVLDGFVIQGGNTLGSSSSYNLQGKNINRDHGGGGLIIDNKNFIFNNLKFQRNRASSYGGGLAIRSSEGSINNCAFESNFSDNAGGFWADNSNINIKDITLIENTVSSDGGGLSIGTKSVLTITNLSAKNNYASRSGAGLKVNNSNVNCYTCEVSNNIAKNGSGGGIISTENSNLQLLNVNINNNTAEGDHGGGIWNGINSILKISKGIIKNNIADNEGGGIYNYLNSESYLEYLEITDNTAYRGGGICNSGFGFDQNSGTSLGSASSNGGAYTLAENCIIARNLARSDGGGVYNNFSSKLELINTTVTANTAKYGGGIYNDSEKCPPIPDDISNYYSCNDDVSTSEVKNSIIWGNIVTGNKGKAIYEGNSNFNSTIYSSFIEGNVNTENDNLNTTYLNPSFIDFANGDYHILPNSPCFNNGNNDYVNSQTDVAGNSRIKNSFVDIGAYEFQELPNDFPIRYVKKGAIGVGTNWANASGDLQLMINLPGVKQVWVAEGTYIPANNGFKLKNNVSVLGGFPNTGNPTLNNRNSKDYPTILSGNDTSRIITNNNSINAKLDSSAVLNGFILQNGFSIGNGGAMFNNNSSPTIEDIIFINNVSEGGLGGGAVYNSTSNPIFKNCVFKQNSAIENGGAIFNEASNAKFINSLFYLNNAKNGGAIAATNNSSYWLINSTISKNSSILGNILTHTDTSSHPHISNTIIYNNTGNNISETFGASSIVNNSIIMGGFSGNANLNINPLFKDANSNDFTLQVTSPAINSGNNIEYENAGFIAEADKDLYGNTRLFDSIIDIGAYEYYEKIYPIRYVKVGGTGNGISWDSASNNLQAMINAKKVEEVWVAAGTYNSPTNGFNLKNNVAIYGGFPSTNNPEFSDRNNIQNLTILSGGNTRRIFNNDFINDIYIDNSAILDGFTLKDGSAIDGGAMKLVNASPTLSNLIFLSNTSIGSSNGGAIYCIASSPKIEKCKFISNTSGMYGGAIINLSNSTPIILNSLFTQNSANKGGAIFAAQNSSYSLVNSTLYENTAQSGGAAYHIGSGTIPNIFNNIIYGNSSSLVNTDSSSARMEQNLIQGITNDNLNYDFNPMFTNPTMGDYTLQESSPAINQGENQFVKDVETEIEIALDLNHQPRIFDYYNHGIVDLGAFEYQGTPLFPIRYVKKDGKGNGTSWGNASGSLQAMINAKDVEQVWVAEGTYISENDGWKLKSNVTVLGGFQNSGNPTLNARNWNLYPTVLSGNNEKRIFYHPGILVNEEYQDSTEVIVIDSTAVLDGFVLTQGYSGENGGAMYNQFASPTLRNLKFTNNHSGENGGAIYNLISVPKISNSSFSNNTADNYGGAIANEYFSEIKVFNTVFSGNNALIGSVYSSSDTSKLILVNSTLTGNISSQNTGALFSYGEGSTTEVYNSILFNNGKNVLDSLDAQTTILYSLVEGGYDGIGNIETDPLFTNASQNNYSLQESSPVINIGDNSLYQINGGNLQNDKDLNLQVRVYNYASAGKIDMGAYEYQGNPKYPIRYVRQNATGSGTSWGTASGDFQAMINASEVQQVWVAEGKYLSTGTGFILKNNVKVLGGFSSMGNPILEERAPVNYNSILSGDNARRVFYNNFTPSNKLTSSAILDGFTITEGYLGNGAGMYNANASPILRNLIFEKNNTTGNGGAMYNAASNPLILNCQFFENTANYGGAVSNASISIPSIVNCLFVENTANIGGGAIYANNASSYNLINSTVYNNLAPTGGGLNHSGNTTHPIVKNSIIYGNGAQVVNSNSATTIVDYSLIEGGYSGINNLSEDPSFENVNDNNFNLSLGSPAINSASLEAIPDSILLDLNGNSRIAQGQIDMGAFENKGFRLANTASDTIFSNHIFPNEEGWIHFYRSDDSTLVLSLNTQNQFLGNIETHSVLNEDFGKGSSEMVMPYQQEKNVYPSNRSWTVHASESFNQPVKVRYYISEIDSIDIMQVMPFDFIKELVVYKVDGDNVWDSTSIDYKEFTIGELSDTNMYVFGEFQGIKYVEFMVNSFSSGTIAMTLDASVLPLDLISFTASAINDKTQLQWRTVNEVNVSHFEIERSVDGIHWEIIQTTSATNGIEQNYTAWDNSPNAGTNYYRLKMIDIDGAYKYSKIVEVTFGSIENVSNFQIYPNPNNGSFIIKANGLGDQILPIKIFDNLGRVIHQIDIKEGANSVDLKNLISGMYYLNIENATENEINKIVIE
jgi:hypothetical protein